MFAIILYASEQPFLRIENDNQNETHFTSSPEHHRSDCINVYEYISKLKDKDEKDERIVWVKEGSRFS